ncbi:MAG: FAD-dependent oxidoreductase [Geodermatophilaceae bacterium]|nr:FAD-dependent oxidoreductase [Geodermatophilaceae bacterium]
MSDRAEPYDLIVLGAGATGLGAAATARTAGRSVALVEPSRPGGDCTHYGCVPSKTLIESARRVAAARDGTRYGFDADVHVDFPAVMRRVAAVVAEIEKDESPALLQRQGIDLVVATGRFVAAHTVRAGERELTAQRIVVAVGAAPTVPPIPGLDQVEHLTNETVFALTEQPRHLVVLGGGPIGCELAQAFARLGSEVTLVEGGDRILPRDEPEASRLVAAALTRDGVTLQLGQAVTGVEDGPKLTLADGSTVTGSTLLVAVGRTPRTSDLDLAIAGVGTGAGGRIVVDQHLATTAEGAYAAGDCASPLQFTHVGYDQGRLAAGNAFAKPGRPGVFGGRKSWDASAIPWVTFTDPEVAHVGLTEAEAYQQYGERARVSYLLDSTSDRARCAGETRGFVKVVAVTPGGLLSARALQKIIGMTVVGPVAGELITQGVLAMSSGMLAGRIAQSVHAYPTWSTSVRIAVAQLFGEFAGRGSRPARPPS